jgi:hypothetical protein
MARRAAVPQTQKRSSKKTKFNPTKESKTMTHDPFQTYMHYGVPSPLGLQYPSLQPSAINPLAALNAILGLSPMTQAAGIPQGGQSPYGMNPIQSFINPQQLQLASLLGLQNPLLAASVLSNPLIAASLHSQAPGPYGVPQFGLQSPSLYPQLGQMGSPFGQIGFPLAPQSWIGQGAQGFGPLQALQSQLIPRPFQAQGPSPWGY